MDLPLLVDELDHRVEAGGHGLVELSRHEDCSDGQVHELLRLLLGQRECVNVAVSKVTRTEQRLILVSFEFD